MSSVVRLRRFADRAADHSCCDLCGSELASRHRHLLELAGRHVRCACDPCSLLFADAHASRFRLIPQAITRIDMQLSDAQWTQLGIPIGLAYFTLREPAEIVAGYPSPAGPVMSSIEQKDWQTLLAANADLRRLRPEVETLLMNRTASHRNAFIVPLDRCFELLGIIRRHWQGWSGGPDVHEKIERYFAQLEAISRQGQLR